MAGLVQSNSNCPMTGNDICYNSHSSIRPFQNRSKVQLPLNQTNYWPIGHQACFICDDLNVPMSGLLVKECILCYLSMQCSYKDARVIQNNSYGSKKGPRNRMVFQGLYICHTMSLGCLCRTCAQVTL